MHVPVLLREVIEILDLKLNQFVIDGTIGSGGHAREIIKQIRVGKILGIDRDKGAIDRLRRTLKFKDVEVDLVNDNYANLSEILKRKKMGKADRLLLDLGFSSEELEAGRGFSFLNPNEPLIMTYEAKSKPLYLVLRELSEEEIVSIIKNLSDERYATAIGKAIYKRERQKAIKKVGDLVEAIKSAVPKNYERGRIHPATRTFMAFRIFVNDELGSLERLLKNLSQILKKGGRAVIITFHSKEDRLVKNYFKEMERKGEGKVLTKHVIRPTWEEVKKNPRSRSAHLRAIEIK